MSRSRLSFVVLCLTVIASGFAIPSAQAIPPLPHRTPCDPIDPAHCLVIEDSVAGIAAGRAAGCLVIACRAGNFAGWDQSGAHRVIDTLDELTPALVGALDADYGVAMGAP